MKKYAILIPCLMFAIFTTKVAAENLTNGEYEFQINAPGGGASIKGSVKVEGQNDSNGTIDASVYGIRESKELVKENGDPDGAANSSYGETNLKLSTIADRTKVTSEGIVENSDSMVTEFAASLAVNSISFKLDSAGRNANVDIKNDGYTASFRSEDGHYVGGETSGTVRINANMPVEINNSGIVSVNTQDRLGDNFIKVTGQSYYSTEPNKTGLASGGAFAQINATEYGQSISAFFEGHSETKPAN